MLWSMRYLQDTWGNIAPSLTIVTLLSHHKVTVLIVITTDRFRS